MSQVSWADVKRRRVVNSNSQESLGGIVGDLMVIDIEMLSAHNIRSLSSLINGGIQTPQQTLQH